MSDSWSRFVKACGSDFSETDLLRLYWDTIRSLLDHYGFSNPVDVAGIELYWKKHRVTTDAVEKKSQDAKDLLSSIHHAKVQNKAPQSTNSPNTTPQKITRHGSITRSSVSELPAVNTLAQSRNRSGSLVQPVRDGNAPTDLYAMFESFCTFGGNTVIELDGAKCVKLCKDCGIIGGKVGLSSTDVELIFAKVRRKGQRKITYAEFRQGFLPEIAARAGRSMEDIVSLCEQGGVPSVQATKAESVRFYDDRLQESSSMRKSSSFLGN